MREDLPDNRADCLEEMQKVSLECIKWEEEIAKARREAAYTGNYQSPKWFSEAESTLKRLRVRRQALQNHLGVINARKKEANSRLASYDYCFVQVCRRRLDADFFEELLAEAKELARNNANQNR